MKYSEKIGFKVCNQETFLRAMNIINPKITILSEYINSSTPVEFLCECGEIHKKSPNRLLNGSRCRKFIGSTIPNKKDEFIKKYKSQLDYYKKALESLTGKNVVKVLIYSFHLDRLCK